jgi:hypothetical protein
VGFFPLDQQLELRRGGWSPALTELAVELSALLPFAQAASLLERAFRVSTAVTTLWRQTQQVGQGMQAVQGQQCRSAMALPERGQSPLRRQAHKRMGAALDGAILHIRQEGWKEVKLGCVFAVEVTSQPDPLTAEETPMATAHETSYVAHLGGPEPIGELLRSEAQRREWERAGDTLVIGDGAPWIWNQSELHFPDSQQLVDWYHAKSHLVEAARLLKGEGTPACAHWLKTRTLTLYQGQAATIAAELRAAAKAAPAAADNLERAAGYFAINAKRMNYLEQRENLWPIGSGVIESAAKQFKARLCGSGMHWSRTGAEAMTTLRAAVLSRRFHDLYSQASRLPTN